MTMKYPKEYLNEIKLRLKVSQVVGKSVSKKNDRVRMKEGAGGRQYYVLFLVHKC